MPVQVLFAVYGALRGGPTITDNIEAREVTQALQRAIDRFPGQLVPINNDTMGVDPAPLVGKHFGALCVVDGRRKAFACQEGQTIDFT